MSYLFSATTNPQVTTTDQTTSTWPAWYQQYLNAIMAKGSAVVDEPYQSYGGPRVAPTTADQTASYDMTRQGVGAYQPMVDTANQYMTQGGAGFNQGQFDTYMNPYISGVVDQIATRGARNLSENLLPQINDSFIKAGQWGGSRSADFTGRALRDTQESILNQQSQALAGGYNSAMDAYQRGNDQKLTAGQGLGSLAGSAQSLGLKDAAALQAIGQEQQGQTQKSLDTAYGDFREQRGYPREQAEWMSSLIRGMNPPTSSTSTSTAPAKSGQLAPSGLAQLAGAGVGLGGLMGWFKDGGKVQRRAKGGRIQRRAGGGQVMLRSTGIGSMMPAAE